MPPLNSGYFVDVRTRRDVRRYPNPLDGSAVDRRWIGGGLAVRWRRRRRRMKIARRDDVV
ncbi:hypothetical protein [Burkholderia thailandensis]|nr:hypothetical protein [Burkholderia thailandensis]